MHSIYDIGLDVHKKEIGYCVGRDELSETRQLANLGKSLSRLAGTRLQWMLFYLFNGRNVTRTCRHFGISRQTFYRWPAGLLRQHCKLRKRPWATRKPKYWPVAHLGDLLEIDTKEMRMRRGGVLKHLSARRKAKCQ